MSNPLKSLSAICLTILLSLFAKNTFGQSAYLSIEDTRDIATLPASYNRALKPSFKRGTAVGLSDATYHTLVGFRGWFDDSGGPVHELAFSNTKGIFYRTGTQATGWSGWRRVLAENMLGNVGIGTDAPKARLSVNGNILANEIKIKTDISVPDYVFESDYELLSLSSIESYVKEHKHLPEIPSAEDIKRDGLDLAEMNLLLLRKIEELTLHLIELSKDHKEMQAEIKSLKSSQEMFIE